MRRTPEDVSRARQKIREQADKWRAGIAAARRELAMEPAKQSELQRRVEYGYAQIALLAQEMKKLNKKAKQQFWPK